MVNEKMNDSRALDMMRESVSTGWYTQSKFDPRGVHEWEAERKAAIEYIAARLRGESGDAYDGWQRMTDEARRIQRMYADSHKGDVYHLLQSLCVRFGKEDKRPIFEADIAQERSKDHV